MGLDRYKILEENLSGKNIRMDWNEAMELLNKAKMGITLWSNVYETSDSKVITAIRKDYNILYEFDINEPLKKIIKNIEPIPEPYLTSDTDFEPESTSEPEYTSEAEYSSEPEPPSEPEYTSDHESPSEPENTSIPKSESVLFSSYIHYSFSFIIFLFLLF